MNAAMQEVHYVEAETDELAAELHSARKTRMDVESNLHTLEDRIARAVKVADRLASKAYKLGGDEPGLLHSVEYAPARRDEAWETSDDRRAAAVHHDDQNPSLRFL